MGVVVEEGVAAGLEVDEFAAVFLLGVELGELGDLFEGDDAVLSGVEDDTGREAFLFGVLGGAVGLGCFGGGEAVGADAFGGDVDDGAEKEEGGWAELFAGLSTYFGEGGAAEGEVGAGAGTGEDHLVRIDAEEVGVGADEKLDHGSVLKRVEGGDACLLVADAIFHGDGDCATHGEVEAVRDHLGGHGGVPEAAVEMDDDGTSVVFGVVIVGNEEMGDEIAVW